MSPKKKIVKKKGLSLNLDDLEGKTDKEVGDVREFAKKKMEERAAEKEKQQKEVRKEKYQVKKKISKYENIAKKHREVTERNDTYRRKQEERKRGCIFKLYIKSWSKSEKIYKVYDFRYGSVSGAWSNVTAGDVFVFPDGVATVNNIYLQATNGSWDDMKDKIQHIMDSTSDMNARTEQDEKEFDNIVKTLMVDDNETHKNISHALDYKIAAEILWVGSPSNMTDNIQPFTKRKLRDAVAQKYISNRFSTFKVNPGFTSLENMLVDEETMEELAPLKQSCMVKAILRTYKRSYDKYHKHNPLNIASIVKTCLHKTYTGGEVELTVEDATKWFVEHQLGLEIYNINNELLYKYNPAKFHCEIRPRIMRIIYHNEHVQRVDDIRSFERTISNREAHTSDRLAGACDKEEGAESKQLSPNYPVKDGAVSLDDTDMCLASTFEEVLCAVKEEKTSIIFNGELDGVLKEFLAAGYTPNITTASGVNISSIQMGDIYIRSALSVKGIKHNFTSVHDYKQYVHEATKFEHTLLNKNTLSCMSPTTIQAFEMYFPQIHTGKLVDYEIRETMQDQFMCFDMNKFYSTCLKDMPYIPVISPFEHFTYVCKSDKHIVSDSNLYIVSFTNIPSDRCLCATNKDETLPYEHPFFNKNKIMLFGHQLMQLHDVPYKIEAYIPIIKRPIGDVKAAVEYLYSDACKLDTDLKKIIANQTIGMSGKKYNRKRTSVAFGNKDDAELHVKTHGGAIFPFTEGVWIANSIKEQRLEDGFLPIHCMVKSEALMKLYEHYKDMVANKIHVVAFKTDAIFIQIPKTKKQKEYIDQYKQKHIKDGLGGMKMEGADKLPTHLPLPKLVVSNEEHEKFMENAKEQERDSPIDIKNLFTPQEFNENDINEVCSHVKPRTVAMSFAGRGKTYTMLHYAKQKYGMKHVLACCAWNAQAKNIKHKYHVEAVTYHRLKGERLNESGTSKNCKAHDVSEIKCIIFDEILLFTHKQLVKICKYMEDHPDIEFLATCDPSQLESIGDIIDNETKKRHIISENMFPNVLRLKINKRFKQEEDRQLLYAIERDLLLEKMKPCDVITKYFSHKIVSSLYNVKELDIKRGVSYFDSSAKTINNLVHQYFPHSKKMIKQVKKLDNGITYYFGGSLICKTNITLKNGKMHPNYEYTIEKMANTKNKQRFVLSDALDGTEYEVSIDNIIKNFSLPYCNTVHSSQGNDIPQKFVIADWKRKDITTNWLYTAITRATNMDHIHFLDQELCDINEVSVAEYMIGCYKQQDKTKHRSYVDGDYITPTWILSSHTLCGGRCYKCKSYMSFEKNGTNKVSVNRLNNDLAHTKANCEIICVLCNKSLSNK